MRHKPVEHALGKVAVASAIDGDEVGRRGQRGEVVRARDGTDDVARADDATHRFREVFLILERGQRADLSDAVDAIVIADLLEGADDARFTDAIADAGAGEAIGLGERAQTQDLRVAGVDRQQLCRWRRIAIGLVEQQQHAGRQSGDKPAQRLGSPEGAHGIVGIADVEDAGVLAPRGIEQRAQILLVVAVGHAHEAAAAAGDMEVEGRVGAVRGDDRGARLDDELHGKPEQAVDALADDDVVEADAMKLRQRRAQFVALGIGVHPVAVGGRAHGSERLGRRAEQAFVGAEPRAKGATAGTLLRLRTDEGHEGRQAIDKSREARSRHDCVRQRC